VLEPGVGGAHPGRDPAVPDPARGPGRGHDRDWPGAGRRTRCCSHSVAALAGKYPGGNVAVVAGDAADLSFPDESFDSAGSFTMLHHVPTPALQNKILAEVLRVLKPGGVLIGSDSLASDDLHHFHAGDTYNPVDPAWLLGRLQTLGFGEITIIVDETVKFIARKPAGCGRRRAGPDAEAAACRISES